MVTHVKILLIPLSRDCPSRVMCQVSASDIEGKAQANSLGNIRLKGGCVADETKTLA